jgi:hypothetical protein
MTREVTVPDSIPPCPPWCDEPAGHEGNHRHHVGEVPLDGYNRPSALAVTVECGPAEVDPLPVLTLGTRTGAPYVQVRLTWPQAGRLSDLLAGAARWYD